MLQTSPFLVTPGSDAAHAVYRTTCQLLYPLLLFMMVWRAIVVRVLPDVLLVFKRFEANQNRQHGFFTRMRTKSLLGYSIFSWADKGEWETVTTSGDVETIRNGDWFRIGFEPVFVDYTKEATWYILEVGGTKSNTAPATAELLHLTR